MGMHAYFNAFLLKYMALSRLENLFLPLRGVGYYMAKTDLVYSHHLQNLWSLLWHFLRIQIFITLYVEWFVSYPCWIVVPILVLKTGNTVYPFSTRVAAANDYCYIASDPPLHLPGSLLRYTRLCIWFFNYDYVWHIFNLPLMYRYGASVNFCNVKEYVLCPCLIVCRLWIWQYLNFNLKLHAFCLWVLAFTYWFHVSNCMYGSSAIFFFGKLCKFSHIG
jgi:hypothetical protein